jgi:ABC-type amino acid transport substrate-binding protein
MDRKLTRRAFNTGLVGMAGATLIGSAARAEDDLLAQIKKRGYMRVGTFSIPPEAWIDINSGEWKGIDADFTHAIAASIGVEADPVVLVHAALAPALEATASMSLPASTAPRSARRSWPTTKCPSGTAWTSSSRSARAASTSSISSRAK